MPTAVRALRRKERRLEAGRRRWSERVSRWIPGGRWTKAQQSSLVEIGGARLKRVIFPDTASAARAHRLTRRAWQVDAAPEPVLLDGGDLWLRFVTGSAVAPEDAAFIPLLVRLYTALWSTGTRSEDPVATGRVAQVSQDLRLLREVGVLDEALVRRLESEVATHRPPALLCGLDYVDPRPDNLIRCDDGLRIVDVESLSEDYPLGSGLAKTMLRWPAARREALVSELAGQGAPDLSAQLPFVELAFLCGWQKRCVLRGKWKLVDPALFQRHLPD